MIFGNYSYEQQFELKERDFKMKTFVIKASELSEERMSEPPRQFLQIIHWDGDVIPVKRFEWAYWEGFYLRELAFSLGNFQFIFRLFYNPKLVDFLEHQERKLWMGTLLIKEMFLRKTFSVTREQVYQRQHEKAKHLLASNMSQSS